MTRHIKLPLLVLSILIGFIATVTLIEYSLSSIKPNNEHIAINEVGYFEDQNKSYTAKQVHQLNKNEFRQISPSHNFGMSSYRHWISIDIDASKQQQTAWELDIGAINSLPMSIYRVNTNNQPEMIFSTSQNTVEAMAYSHHVSFDTVTQKQVRFYVSIESLFGVHINLQATSPQSFYQKLVNNALKIGFTTAVLFSLAFINFLAFISLRKRYLLYYSLQILSSIPLLYTQHGFILDEFASLTGGKYQFAYFSTALLFSIFSFLFCNSFLDVYKTSPHITRRMRWVIIITSALMLCSASPFIGLNNIIIFYLLLPLAMLIIGTPGYLAIRHWPNADTPQRLYAISWVAMFIMMSVFAAHEKNLISISMEFIQGALTYTFLLDGILLAIALHLNISNLRKSENQNREKLIETLNERINEIKEINRLSEERNAAIVERIGKTQFMASSGHDIQHAIVALDLNLNSILARDADIKKLNSVKSAIRYLKDITLGIIHSSRDELLNQPENRVFIDDIFEDIAEGLNNQAKEKGLELRYFQTSANYSGSEIALKRILKNLVGNAIKYTDKGKILMGVRRRPNGLLLFVMDTGRGISQENKESIQKLFQQSGTAKAGFGIGLHTVKQLCDQENYTFDISNNNTQGCLASVFIPNTNARQ